MISIFLLIRVLLVFSSGYIHPDEFFQSQEVFAKDVFGFETDLPWEFNYETGTVYRSYLPPFLFTGVPYLIVKYFAESKVKGYVLFFLPRLILFLYSLVTDYLVTRIAKELKLDVKQTLFWYQSSWVAMVFFSRPFSNTTESFVFVMCLSLAVLDARYRSILFGILTGFGTFARITFPAFIFPAALYLLYSNDQRLGFRASKQDKHLTITSRLVSTFKTGCAMLIGFSLSCAACIVFDSVYLSLRKVTPARVSLFSIESLNQLLTIEMTWVIAPLNNILYNTKIENLALHGLHPRYLHALVNMQLLFGPLFFVFIVNLLRGKIQKHALFFSALILVPLGALSIFPHQEARFLVPLLAPISLATVAYEKKTKRSLQLMWLIFNMLLAAFYSSIHQAGIVQASLTLTENIDRLEQANSIDLGHICIASYETYTIPKFTFASEHGMDLMELKKLQNLKNIIQKSCNDGKKNNEPFQWILLFPGSEKVNVVQYLKSNSIQMIEIGSYFPHVSTESFPQKLEKEQFSLLMYTLK